MSYSNTLKQSSSASGLRFQKVVHKEMAEMVSSGLPDLVNNPLDYLLDTGYWQWRYPEPCHSSQDTPSGTLMVSRIDNLVIGKVGNLLLPFCVAGRKIQVPLMEGLSFLPDYRSWSRLRGLLALSYHDRHQVEPEFSFAVSPRSSIDLYQRIGCVVTGQMPIYTVVINGSEFALQRGIPFPLSLLGWCLYPMFGARSSTPSARTCTVRRIESFGPEFDQLWNTISPKRCVAIAKTASYLNWRYAHHPGNWYDMLAAHRSGQLSGLVIFRKVPFRKQAFLLELLAENDDPEVMAQLLDASLKQMRAEGVASVTTSFLDGSPVTPLLEKNGFSTLPTRFWDMQMITEVPDNCQETPANTLANWELSLGDWLLH